MENLIFSVFQLAFSVWRVKIHFEIFKNLFLWLNVVLMLRECQNRFLDHFLRLEKFFQLRNEISGSFYVPSTLKTPSTVTLEKVIGSIGFQQINFIF